MRISRVFVIIALIAAAAGCGEGSSQQGVAKVSLSEGERLRITATTTIAADVVSQIAGEKAEVLGLMKTGQDPHSYEPSPKELARMSSSHIIFINGFGLEEGLLKTIKNTGNTPVVELSSRITPITSDSHDEHHHDGDHHDDDHNDADHNDADHHDEDHHDKDHHDDDHHDADHHDDDHHDADHHDKDHHDDDHHDEDHHDEDHHDADHHDEDHHDADHHDEDHHDGEHHAHSHGPNDPHTWMSPRNVISWTNVIADSLSKSDPDNAGYYKARAAEYRGKLSQLDAEIQRMVSTIPGENRVIISGHRQFEYFARDYGFETPVAIQESFSTISETSAKQTGSIIDLVEEYDVPALFVGNTEGSGIRKLMQMIKSESSRNIQILEVLSGSLTEEGGRGPDYLSYIGYNARQFIKGLQGKAE